MRSALATTFIQALRPRHLIWACLAVPALAAADSPSPAAAAAGDGAWLTNVWSLIQSGGYTMAPIFAAMLVGLTFTGERYWSTRRALIDPPNFEDKLLQTLTVLGADDALKMCAQNNTVLSRVVGHAIKRYKFDIGTLRDAVLDQCARENLRLKRPLRVVNLMAQLLPMLGLFGTVVGMILAFRTIGHSASGVTDYAKLGESISVALVTTLFGLLFAIPLMVCYNFLRSRIDHAVQRVEWTASTLIDEILLREVHHMRLEKDLQAQVETRQMPAARLAEEVDLSEEFAEEGTFKSSVTTPANPVGGDAVDSRAAQPGISQHITSAAISGIGRHAVPAADPMAKKPRPAGDSAQIPTPEKLPEQSPEERRDKLDAALNPPKLRKSE